VRIDVIERLRAQAEIIERPGNQAMKDMLLKVADHPGGAEATSTHVGRS
jgi:hypothetical protein